MIEITDKILNEFQAIADELAIWKKLPSGKDRGTLAMRLAEWCQGHIERGHWLVAQADQFNEYPGPAAIREMISNKFSPAGPMATYAGSAPVAAACGACGDTGMVWQLERRSYRWCTCAVALEMQVATPDWLTFSNSFRRRDPVRRSTAQVDRDLRQIADVGDQRGQKEAG